MDNAWFGPSLFITSFNMFKGATHNHMKLIVKYMDLAPVNLV